MGKKPSGVGHALNFVADHTFALKHERWMDNLGENMQKIRSGKDVRELPSLPSAIVVGAGPSVEKYGHLRLLKESGCGATIVCDKALIPCLREGIVPHIVMGADADEAVEKFYDDELVRDNGKTKAVLNVITHPKVVARVPYPVFWYLTPYDDPFSDHSLTNNIHFMTGKKSIMSSFGNVGGQAFGLACFLGASEIILVGLDFGYPADFPLEKTPYYGSYKWLADKRGRRVGELFTRIKNPSTNEEVLTDFNFSVYREIFLLHMLKLKGKVRVINSSPTSSLFGEGIEFMPLEEALKRCTT